MVGLSSSAYQLLFFVLVLVFTPFPSDSADPDPLQDICVADLNATFSVNGYPCKPISKSFPGLNTQGISMARADLSLGGLVPPHTHPRASETVVVIEGKVLVGFVTTANVFYSKVLTAGQMFIIPRGLVHFQLNVGQEKALILASFNSQLPGVVVDATSLFATKPPIPNQVLTKAFQVGDDVINLIKSKFGA
ncbi:Germin [Parasponia andersonii]|uniref:Germin-like protein n=1 Tax=Parasponia andersonii TaxID=3476 RepID=A0A2P5CIZ4_PARAD|nr:Germin [Parasponia andersonii]